MSTESAATRLRGRWSVLSGARERAVAVLFGDRIGLVVFLAAVCVFGLVWRTAFLINDSYTVANGLYALSNGQVGMTEAAYGPTLDTPGATELGDRWVARNYGVIALSVPLLFALEGLAAVVELRIALLALWSLALLGLLTQVGRLRDNDTIVVAGGIVVLTVFGVNASLARPLDPTALDLYALQLLHLLVAAFTPVLLYRLVARIHTRRLGGLAAALVVLGTPLAFWATVPKRHAITGTAVICVAYFLYRSRGEADGVSTRPWQFRALAYATVGLYAWVHAPEALLFLVALGAVDVPTAPDNSPRTLVAIGVVFLLSLLPFLATNMALSGSPIEPPRLLAGGGTAGGTVSDGGASSGGGSSATTELSRFDQLRGAVSPLIGYIRTGLTPLLILTGELAAGATTIRTQPAEVYHAFVRSGSAASALDLSGEESVNLSLLESAPVLVALVGVIPAMRTWTLPEGIPDRRLPAATVVDLFAAASFVGIALLYVGRLPIHAQVTARYLFPLYPLGVYLLVRVPVVRRVLDSRWRLYCWTVAGTVLLGGQLAVLAVFLTAAGIGEAFQFHALAGVTTALPLGLWALTGRAEGRTGQAGAVLLGVATGAAAVFVLLTALEYYALGGAHLLPMLRALAERLALY